MLRRVPDDGDGMSAGELVAVLAGLFALAVVLVAVILRRLGTTIRSRRRPRPTRPEPLPRRRRLAGSYEWERRADKLQRQLKKVPSPAGEDRGGILLFLESHLGVEAYVEPKTVMHPLSVVLIDGDGTWRRFELKDDSYLRELARTAHLLVLDAARVGYPERMLRPGRTNPRGDPPPA
jgi:hypothetical protein